MNPLREMAQQELPPKKNKMTASELIFKTPTEKYYYSDTIIWQLENNQGLLHLTVCVNVREA